MSLTAAMNIGRSALAASQVGIQVTGNNIANVATPGYSRQVTSLAPIGGTDPYQRLSAGRGVGVTDVRRQVDMALQSRLWLGTADKSASQQNLDLMTQVESVLGELSGNDLSSEMSAFFNAWSERANNTQSAGTVVQHGDKLAGMIRRIRTSLGEVRTQIGRDLDAAVSATDSLLDRVASLNGAISASEVSGAQSNSLRDQRDQVITELSQLLDVSVVERQGGSVDILVGSTPIVLGGESRGVTLKYRNDDGVVNTTIAVKDDGEELSATSGRAAALLASRDSAVDTTVERLDTIASQLIFQINRLHSTGANLTNLASTTGFLKIGTSDRALAMNDPTNETFSRLPYAANNGGFSVRVKNLSDGSTQTIRIDVDLDGVDSTGAPGFADDTSAEDIRAALAAVPGLTASFNAEGKLQVRAAEGMEFSFQDDSSGALAVLGLNSYFTGDSATDIAVRSDLKNDPSKLMSGRIVAGAFTQNGTALAVVNLQDAGNTLLGGRSLRQGWTDAVQAVGVRTAAADSTNKALAVVQESLESQRAAISGVSVDEESINLLNFQRQYQGAARVISVADELTQTLIALV
jgi:flagellar hook-associated protein 1